MEALLEMAGLGYDESGQRLAEVHGFCSGRSPQRHVVGLDQRGIRPS